MGNKQCCSCQQCKKKDPNIIQSLNPNNFEILQNQQEDASNQPQGFPENISDENPLNKVSNFENIVKNDKESKIAKSIHNSYFEPKKEENEVNSINSKSMKYTTPEKYTNEYKLFKKEYSKLLFNENSSIQKNNNNKTTYSSNQKWANEMNSLVSSNLYIANSSASSLLFLDYYFKMIKETTNEFVIYDENLLKLNKGLQSNLISKYCRLTDHSFQYFRNEMCSFNDPLRPFLKIPLSIIEYVRIVTFQEPFEQKKYFFEIVAPKMENIYKKKHKDLLNIVLEKSSRNLNKDRNRSFENESLTTKYVIRDNHLMRKSIPEFNEAPLPEIAPAIHDGSIFYKGLHFKSEVECNDFQKFKKQNLKELLLPYVITIPKDKRVGQQTKMNFHWTYRQIDWYNFEKRFIFASDSEKIVNRFVCLMNWLIQAKQNKH